MEKKFRTKELKTHICPFTLGMMPPASICKTVRAVFIKRNILIGDDACGCWVLLFFPCHILLCIHFHR